MEPISAIILGLASLFGTIVGSSMNRKNNEFIDETNEQNREFQEQTNLQNHQWSQQAAEWEYEHEKPQRQYADLLAAGLTPAAAAQTVSGANVSYSPATAVAPQNMPKSTNILNDSLQQVIGNLGNYSSMAQAEASAAKTRAETKVITETAIKRANAEIDKILSDILKSYSDIAVNESDIAVNESDIAVNNANIDLTNERKSTEQVNRHSIELSNEERQIQLEFTRKTLEMSVQKTQAEIKLLSEQTAKLQEEVGSMQFDIKYQEWRNTYIETYGVAPEQGWEDTLFKAVIDGNAKPMLDALSESLRQIFDSEGDTYSTPYRSWQDRRRNKQHSIRNAKPINPINGRSGYHSIGEWYGYGSSW